MEHWYVLRTAEKKEEEAAGLLKRVMDHTLWGECRVLRKLKVFRSGGRLHLLDEILFPGYIFLRTGCPEGLAGELRRSRELPQFLAGGEPFAALDPKDLAFLMDVCGEDLRQPMGITRVVLNGDSRIVHADGVLSPYLDRVVRLNLRKRFALVEVPLFNRAQPVLFGLCLPQDQAGWDRDPEWAGWNRAPGPAGRDRDPEWAGWNQGPDLAGRGRDLEWAGWNGIPGPAGWTQGPGPGGMERDPRPDGGRNRAAGGGRPMMEFYL